VAAHAAEPIKNRRRSEQYIAILLPGYAISIFTGIARFSFRTGAREARFTSPLRRRY
jgi:hypothetical protein